jgi:hypothetical protein
MTMPDSYREIWAVDFEFSAPPGERPRVACLVAKELKTGKTIRLMDEALYSMDTPPYCIGPESLFIAYFASAEFSCHLALGWGFPENVLDLYSEFRCATNGKELAHGNGQLGSLLYFGLEAMSVTEKETMRQLAMRGAPWTEAEKLALLDYCESDVVAVERLFNRMSPQIDLPRAILRGRYFKAVARIEYVGVPIDMPSLNRLKENWDNIQDRCIESIDGDYGVYDGRTFKQEMFEAYLVRNHIPWPRLPSGQIALSDDVFKDMSRAYPILAPLRELRSTLFRMRLSDLAVGGDGRNRCMLSPFRSKTGRNQPSTSRFIFGPSVWLRRLIKPGKGYALGYVDWSQQEFGIAAALSNDPAMMVAYESGDPYMAFAIQAGAAPTYATKASHSAVREQFKACALAVLYGMGAESLAQRIGQPTFVARRLLQLHRET